MGFFVALLVHGLLAGALYALLALAFVVVYKASRLMNFALGDCVMFAARLAAAGLQGCSQDWPGPPHALVAPGAIRVGHPSDQGLELLVNRGAPWDLALWGAIKLLGDEPAMPAEPGGRRDALRHFLQARLAQLLAQRASSLARAGAQPEAPLALAPQHPVLCHQGLMASPPFLIHGPRDICQQGLPAHRPLHLHLCRFHLAVSLRDGASRKPPKRGRW